MPKRSPFERFQSYCKQDPSGCTLWIGRLSSGGYGRFAFGGARYVQAHRWIYERLNGPIPIGGVIMHACDVRNCVNPQHLRLGTQKLNAFDMKQKGRAARGARHHNAKLTETEAKKIISLIAKGENRQNIADRFGITVYNVTAISQGKAWRHLPRPDMSQKRTGHNKLAPSQIPAIRALLEQGMTGAKIAMSYGVSDGTISMIKLGKTHVHR